MRIQHNITAMNAYRNYNANTSAVAKNLEKLSSGYRINRAGDDAAGLAISEKMRAQISGLTAAEKNVKDGLSLVKTAEGATQEIHDMLNRMVTLAEQSANGTYQDEVDREAIVNEFNQLKEEINRIADSSNFNGIKLLDGSLAGGPRVANEVDAAITPTADGQLAKAPQAGIYSVDFKNASVTNTGTTDVTDATFKIFNQTLTLKTIAKDGGTLEGKDLAEEIAKKWNAQTANSCSAMKIQGVKTIATVEGSKVVFTMEKAPASIDDSKYKGTTGEFSNVKQNNGHEVTVTQEQEAVSTSQGRLYGQATLDLTADIVKDGGTIKIGDTTYVFAVGPNSKYKGMDNMVDLTDTAKVDSDALITAARRLSEAAKDNKNFKVGSDLGQSATITFTEKEGGVDYAKNNLAGADGKGTNNKGFNKPQDADASAADWAGLIRTGVVDTTAKGQALTLQIGDTSDTFNQLKVSVSDMHTKALGLDSLNLGTQEGAQKAVSVIKDAVNYVSQTRGRLGATQNRLEHTQNNLSTMKENIQDAESTIRDTDIAEEMMAYTKNSILVQSAQAMLAQANQIPQGVLQLLG